MQKQKFDKKIADTSLKEVAIYWKEEVPVKPVQSDPIEVHEQHQRTLFPPLLC